jgi:predicted RNA-binding Zn ribbon-like protein
MSDSEFLLLGDALWLELVNTLPGPNRADALPDAPAWLRFTKALRLEQPENGAVFQEAIGFREKLVRLAQALEGQRNPPGAAVDAVNERLSSLPGREQLVRVSGTWHLRFAPARPPSALEAIARSAADTLALPVALLRRCANPVCGLYLLDNTTNLSRRFCSPARCGKLGRTERRRRSRPTPIVNEA